MTGKEVFTLGCGKLWRSLIPRGWATSRCEPRVRAPAWSGRASSENAPVLVQVPGIPLKPFSGPSPLLARVLSWPEQAPPQPGPSVRNVPGSIQYVSYAPPAPPCRGPLGRGGWHVAGITGMRNVIELDISPLGAGYRVQVTGDRLQVAGYRLQGAGYRVRNSVQRSAHSVRHSVRWRRRLWR